MELSSFCYFKHVLGDAEIYFDGLCSGTVPRGSGRTHWYDGRPATSSSSHIPRAFGARTISQTNRELDKYLLSDWMNALVFCPAFFRRAWIIAQLFSGKPRVCWPRSHRILCEKPAPHCPEESYLAAKSAVARRKKTAWGQRMDFFFFFACSFVFDLFIFFFREQWTFL